MRGSGTNFQILRRSSAGSLEKRLNLGSSALGSAVVAFGSGEVESEEEEEEVEVDIFVST
jgi:hypothetical protein